MKPVILNRMQEKLIRQIYFGIGSSPPVSATLEVSDSAPTQWANSAFPLSPLILILYSFPSAHTTALNTGQYTAYSKHPTTIARGNQRGSSEVIRDNGYYDVPSCKISTVISLYSSGQHTMRFLFGLICHHVHSVIALSAEGHQGLGSKAIVLLLLS